MIYTIEISAEINADGIASANKIADQVLTSLATAPEYYKELEGLEVLSVSLNEPEEDDE
jgi:hypothetical protein